MGETLFQTRKKVLLLQKGEHTRFNESSVKKVTFLFGVKYPIADYNNYVIYIDNSFHQL